MSPRAKPHAASASSTPAPIAIVSDFGYRDHYAGVMRGVIAAVAPDACVIDITHGIAPQSVIAGALALRQSWRFFPKKTVFLAVVDPGVGTTRRPIAIETHAGIRLVGPDNGVLSLAADDAGIARMVELRSPRYRLKSVSSTFHGRDIFAPAAAWLSRGTPIRSLGPAITQITRLSIGAAVRRAASLEGKVVYADGFGNLVTNIDRATLESFSACFHARRLLVRIGKGASMKIFQAYADAPVGAPLAIFGSFELLEIAIRNGSAASRFRSGEGAPVTVIASK